MSVMRQSPCLVNDKGWIYMEKYDALPRCVRDKLKSSKFNLCVMCVKSAKEVYHCSWDEAIKIIEDVIRR